MHAVLNSGRERGTGLLLAHCAWIADDDERRLSPLERLRAEVGDELARLLLNALAGGGGSGR